MPPPPGRPPAELPEGRQPEDRAPVVHARHPHGAGQRRGRWDFILIYLR